MQTILIRGGRVICPQSDTEQEADVALAAGQVLAVGAVPSDFVADITLDATGCVLAPGLLDLRARPGMPEFHGSGSLERELAVAAQYGITQVVCPPDMNPQQPLDQAGVVDMLRHGAEGVAGTRVLPLGALTQNLRGTELANLHTLERAGCVGFSQGDRPLPDKRMLLRAMQYAATGGQSLWLRPLDAELGQGVAASGALALRMGLEGVPEAAETIALHSLFALMGEVPGVRLHVQGISCAASVELLRQAKAGGLAVTADVSIHSLLLSEQDIGYFDSRTRLNPPLRRSADRAALQAGLADGTLDALVSDHTRVNLDGKVLPFAQAQPGARGLELLLSVALHWGRELGLSLAQSLAPVTARAAQVLGQAGGYLTVGAPADICVFDPEAENWIHHHQAFAALSPFAYAVSGLSLRGQVRATIAAGRLCYTTI